MSKKLVRAKTAKSHNNSNPKPEYIDIAENLYRPGLQHLRYTEDIGSACKCTWETGGCGNQCLNRILYIECDPSTCPCTRRDESGAEIPCANTVIQFGRYPKLQVFHTPNSGFALRVLEDIGEETIICEYRGEVLTIDQSMKRMSKYKSSDGFYFAALGNNLVLDACKMGSVARFANHSCDPNSYLQRWTVRGESRIVLTANEPLKAGTEVCYSYNFNDDGFSSNPIKSQKCYCGSAFCTGTVGGVSTMRHDINDTFHYARRILDGELKLTKQQIEAFIQDSIRIQEASKLVRDQAKSVQKLLQRVIDWQNEAQQMLTLQDPTNTIYEPIPVQKKSTFASSSAALQEQSTFHTLFPFMKPSAVHLKKYSAASAALPYARVWTQDDLTFFLQQMPPTLKCEEEKTLRQRLNEAKKLEVDLLQWKVSLFGNKQVHGSIPVVGDIFFYLLEKWKERYHGKTEDSQSCNEQSRTRKRKRHSTSESRKKSTTKTLIKSVDKDDSVDDKKSDDEAGTDDDTDADNNDEDEIHEKILSTSHDDKCVNAKDNDATSITEGVTSAQIDPTLQLTWPVLMSLLRRVFSVIPVRCNHTDWLFSCLDAVDRLVYEELQMQSTPIRIPQLLIQRYRVLYLQPKKSELQHLYSDAMIIAQMWRHYGPLLSLPSEQYQVVNQEHHWMMSMIANDYFQVVSNHHDLRLSALSSLFTANRQSQGKKSSYLTYHAFPIVCESNKVFCFCRLPETSFILSDPATLASKKSDTLEKETASPALSNDSITLKDYQHSSVLQQVSQRCTMIQCDGCQDWFHPICCAQRLKKVSEASISSSSAAKRNKQSDKDTENKETFDAKKDTPPLEDLPAQKGNSSKRSTNKTKDATSSSTNYLEDTQQQKISAAAKRTSTGKDDFVYDNKTVQILQSTKRTQRNRDTIPEPKHTDDKDLQFQKVEEIILEEEETDDSMSNKQKFFCPACTIGLGQLPDYAFATSTQWEAHITQSWISSHIQTTNGDISLDLNANSNWQKHVNELFVNVSPASHLTHYFTYLTQWQQRASSFIHTEVRDYLQAWMKDTFVPEGESSNSNLQSEEVAKLSALFFSSDTNKTSTAHTKENSKAKVGDRKRKLPTTDTADSSAEVGEESISSVANQIEDRKEKKKKVEKTSKRKSGEEESYEKDQESAMIIVFKRALQLFMEPFLLVGETKLTSEMATILSTLRVLLWILSTTSIWQILYQQYCIHQYSALVSATSPFLMLQQLAFSTAGTEKTQITLAMLRKLAAGGEYIQQSFMAVSTVMSSSMVGRLFDALINDLTHLLRVTETLLHCGRQLQSQPNLATAQAIVCSTGSTPFQRRDELEVLIDLLDLDGRSVLSGGMIYEDDDTHSYDTVVNGPKRPAAHYDLVCLLALAQQHRLVSKNAAASSVEVKTDASATMQEVSTLNGNIPSHFLFCATPESFVAWLNQQSSLRGNSINNHVGEEGEESYCWCGQTDDGVVPMLACDKCNEWYHAPCVRMWSRLRAFQHAQHEHRRVRREQEKLRKQQLQQAARASSKRNVSGINTATYEDATTDMNENTVAVNYVVVEDTKEPELSFVCVGCCLVERKPYMHAWVASTSS